MKRVTKALACGMAIFALVKLSPSALGQKVPEISSPVRQSPGDYPETIGGAPGSKGFAMGSPRVSNQTHGWKLPVSGRQQLIQITEILRSPEPNTYRTWDPKITLTTSADRRSCMARWSQYPRDGWIENSWEFEPCDPKGWHSFEVYFDGQLVGTIPFEVK